jgi:hypothetical protein
MSEQSEREPFQTWAIVELFGHQQIAGLVAEQELAGGVFLRVDVPEVPGKDGRCGRAAFTRFYGAAAIYSLTPVSEEIARRAVEYSHYPAVTVYGADLPRLVQPDGRPDEFDGESQLPF